MNNEIGRKLTSLTLMTIMVAGGLTFAIPGAMPAAHAQSNANLFVSAENSQFNNYMAGPQVIEVVVIDPDIDDTDEGKGEPDVNVNGKDLRMVQSTDGNWYGYFADRRQAQIADQTIGNNATKAGTGLDFGTFCGPATDISNGAAAISLTNTVGIAIQRGIADFAAGGSNGTTTAFNAAFPTCTGPFTGAAGDTMNVIREQKSINPGGGGVDPGQIDLDVDLWPFIQLYNLNPTGNVIIQYNKGGGAQSVTLTFDSVDQFADTELDRTKYPRNAEVHVTLTDLQLNIDPTDEDSWTFATNNNGTFPLGTFYQVFTENGDSATSAGGGAVDAPTMPTNINTGVTLGNLMFEDNGILIIDVNTQGAATPILNFFDNDDQALFEPPTAILNPTQAATFGGGLTNGTQPVTFTELSSNSGIFSNYDESDNANLETTNDLTNRGKSATIDYNETPKSIVIGFDYATVDIQPVDDEWSSGEEIPVVIVDTDANKNTRVDEDLDLFSNDVNLIPALQTGDPFSIGEGGTEGGTVATTFVYGFTTHNAAANAAGVFGPLTSIAAGANLTLATNVELFSQRAVMTSNGTLAAADTIFIDLGVDAQELFDTITAPAPAGVPAGGPGVPGGIAGGTLQGFNLYNQDLRSVSNLDSAISNFDVYIVNNTAATPLTSATGAFTPTNTLLRIADDISAQDLVALTNATINTSLFSMAATDNIGLLIDFDIPAAPTTGFDTGDVTPVVADFFSFGFTDDGEQAAERVANQLIRIEAEETGDNTSTFEGSLEYVMVNQLNILDLATYTGISPIADDPSFIVIEDLTDEDAPRVNYFDVDLSGVPTTTSDQEEAPSHSGIVSFDMPSYKVGDTVFITVEDRDLNVDSDLVEIYTTVDPANCPVGGPCDPATETVGEAGSPLFTSFGALGRLLDVTFDDELWAASTADLDASGAADCATPGTPDDGLFDTDFTLVESGPATGVFSADFLVPNDYCSRNQGGLVVSVTGLDMEVNYVDFRDASGEIIEVGDSAGIRANTGSVSLDRTVYPVPWGRIADIAAGTTGTSDSNGLSIFPVHATGIAINANGGGVANRVDDPSDTLRNGDVTIHVRVNDPDFDVSPTGEDVISILRDTDNDGTLADEVAGPIKITVSRGAAALTLTTAGGPNPVPGLITTGTTPVNTDPVAPAVPNTREAGPLTEIAPDAGIFELDFPIRYTDGPASNTCPGTVAGTNYVVTNGAVSAAPGNIAQRFDTVANPIAGGQNFCILQGDILTVEYRDPTDASGDPNTVTDSATFDLRNGVLQSDKSVYIIGADMILTIIEPDWDRDNDAAETYDLDVIEWDSDAATVSMGDKGGEGPAFDPEPSNFRETGDSTGIFQIVIEIPDTLAGDRLERGEEIVLEYTDWGPSGADHVGEEEEDVNLTIFTSNFGATVELDQKVYSWTDKVYITIVAPDHNFDSDLIDEIGESATDPIKVATRGQDIDRYKLVETGTDTGIFTGEVILTGFPHDADGDTTTGTGAGGFDAPANGPSGVGPTDGFLPADDDDGITVSFEFSEDETVVGSALIRWNIGEVQFLEASYPASGTGVVRVVDPDMNLNPEAVDNFNVDVWSDSDSGGIDLTVTETNEATGIFEGTVFFTVTDESSGHRLRVAEGDTITAEYEDNTLPDPYTTADELDITGTAIIGTIVPPLERAPASNARVVDAFGNALAEVQVDQQVQITADLANGQDREQSFAYLVQIQDSQGVTVSLAWITGSLSPGQSFSPALSWIPNAAGVYTATVFVWQSVDNPTALSPPISVDIRVV